MQPLSEYVQRQKIRRLGLLMIALPLGFQVITLLTLAWMVRADMREQQSLAASQRVLISSNRLLSILLNGQSGVRGYALTGDPDFLAPFAEAEREYPVQLARLRSAASADAADEVGAIAAAADDFLAFLRRQVHLIRVDRRDEAVAAIADKRGLVLMTQFRNRLETVVNAQRSSAEAHSVALARMWDVTIAALVAGFVLNVVVAVAVAVVFVRGMTRRLKLVMENTERFERGEPLHNPVAGEDEIAELDRRFHQMTDALTEGRAALERVNAELESFSYSVSHDLRAPLRALIGYTRMLDEDCAGQLDAEGRRYVAVIRDEAQRLGVLIDDLLAFARIGKVPVRWSSVGVEELVREVVAEVCPPDAQVRIDPLPPCVGDRSMLRHVLTNLVGNAVKFRRPGEPVRIHIMGEEGPEAITYSIRDEGIGFDMKYAHKLFGVFQRLHSGDEVEGTGVGLAIVKRVIERHGGTVTAEGETGRGASFSFTIPSVTHSMENDGVIK